MTLVIALSRHPTALRTPCFLESGTHGVRWNRNWWKCTRGGEIGAGLLTCCAVLVCWPHNQHRKSKHPIKMSFERSRNRAVLLWEQFRLSVRLIWAFRARYSVAHRSAVAYVKRRWSTSAFLLEENSNITQTIAAWPFRTMVDAFGRWNQEGAVCSAKTRSQASGTDDWWNKRNYLPILFKSIFKSWSAHIRRNTLSFTIGRLWWEWRCSVTIDPNITILMML